MSEEAKGLLAVIRASCGLLLGIVTNVLTARLVETGQLTLTEVLFDPTSALTDIVQVCRLGCGVSTDADYGIRWTSDKLPRLVEGDRDRCEHSGGWRGAGDAADSWLYARSILQIVQNLVTNAGAWPSRVDSPRIRLTPRALHALQSSLAAASP